MIKKKILFLLIAALFFMPSTIHVNADPQVGVFVPPNSMTDNTGYYFDVEGLFLRPTQPDPFVVLSHTNNTDDVTGANGGPADVVNAEYGRDGGFRASIGRNVPNSPLEFGVEFTGIFSSATTDVEEGGDVDTLIIISAGGTDSLAEADRARATTDVEILYWDLMAKYNVKFGQGWLFTMGTGLRIANFEHDVIHQFRGADCVDSNFDNDDGCFNSSNQDFWGVGPTAHTKVGWDIGNGFNLVASANLSLLAGEMETIGRTISTDPGDNELHYRDDSSRVVPVIDMKIAAQWAKQITSALRLNVLLGYEFQNWFNVRDKAVSTADLSANFTTERIDLGLEGPFFRIGAEF